MGAEHNESASIGSFTVVETMDVVLHEASGVSSLVCRAATKLRFVRNSDCLR